MPSVISEHQQWFDAATGELLVNGNVYIGASGLDPEVLANQITIYSDRALTTAIANPQTTDSNGQTSNKIYVPQFYSIAVTNSADVTKYSNLDNGDGGMIVQSEEQTATAGQTVITLADLTYAINSGNVLVYINGVKQASTAYTETSTSSITLSGGLDAGDLIEVMTGNSVVSTDEISSSLVAYTPAGTGAVQTTVQAKLRESVSAADFGATGDGATDDWAALQAGYDAVGVAGGGELFIPQQSGAYYLIRQALRFRYPNVTVRCESAETRIHCDPTGQGLGAMNRWPNYGVVLFGSYTTNNIDLLTADPINNTTRNDESITTTTAADAGDFTVGDVILIQSTSRYTIGSTTRPIWGQLNVVTSADAGTGVIGVRHVVQKNGAAEVLLLDNNGVNWQTSDGTDSGEAQFAVRDNKILGGWWSTETAGAPFDGGGGSIDCVVDIDRSSCRNGPAYGNLMAHSVYKVLWQESRRTGVELAYCSHDNVVEVVSDELKDLESTSDAAVWCNESSRNNSVTIQEHHGNSFAHKDCVRLTASDGNRIYIGLAWCDSVTEAAVHIIDSNYTGTRPITNNNLIEVNKVIGFSGTDCVKFTGNGQEKNNEVRVGTAYGTGTNAIRFDGDADCGDRVRDSWFETGGIVLGSSSTGHVVTNCDIPDGLPLAATDWDTEIQNGFFDGMRTDKSKLLRQAEQIAVTRTITSAAAYTLTSTIKANSFENGDTLNFYMGCSVTVSTASNKTWLLTLGGSTIISYVYSSATLTEVIIRACITRQSSTVGIVHLVIYEGDAVTETRVINITGLDFTTDEDFVCSITVAAVSNTVVMRHAQVKANSANAGNVMVI